jgi:hypothetical protein
MYSSIVQLKLMKCHPISRAELSCSELSFAEGYKQQTECSYTATLILRMANNRSTPAPVPAVHWSRPHCAEGIRNRAVLMKDI